MTSQTDALPDNSPYLTAYRYLNKSAIDGNAQRLEDNCRRLIKSSKLNYKDDLQVGERFVRNDHGFPMCDFLKKKYGTHESCAFALGSGKSVLAKQVQDSLELFWQGYEMKPDAALREDLCGLVSERKSGYMVFFSDIYKNTLAAEVKSFCLPYDEGGWQGSSTSFFFIFDDTGQIKEVYSEAVIHYN